MAASVDHKATLKSKFFLARGRQAGGLAVVVLKYIVAFRWSLNLYEASNLHCGFAPSVSGHLKNINKS